MYVSELFVGGECIIDSLAGPGKKLGVLGGDDLKNNNDAVSYTHLTLPTIYSV